MATRLATKRLFTASTLVPRSNFRRTMASSSAAAPATGRKYDFLVIAPDKPDARERRLAARG
jgi:hypothetical protein